MQTHSDSYNPYSDVRHIGVRVTVFKKDVSVSKPVCTMANYHNEAWVTFSSGAFTDGDYETAAGVTKYPLPSGFFAACMNVSVQPSKGAYIKITLSENNTYPLFGIQVDIKTTNSDNHYGKSFGAIYSNVIVFDSVEESAFSGLNSETVIGYTLFFPGGTVINEIETTRPEPASIVLTQDDIETLEIQESADITGASFPSRSFSCKADNRLGFFDVANLDKFIGYGVKAEIAVDGEYINVGLFTISKIEGMSNGSIAKIAAQDDVLRMDSIKTGLSSGNSAIALSRLIGYGSGAVSGVTFDLDAGSAQALVAPSMMTTVDSQRNCLKKLAQAARLSAIWTGRDNVVKIYPLIIPNGGGDFDCELYCDNVYDYNGLSVNDKTDYVEVSGTSGTGKAIATAGKYSSGCKMVTVSNDFITQSEVVAIAQNLFAAKNHRFSVKIKTRCDPALEIGDRVKLKGLKGETIGTFVVIGNSMVFDGGLSATLDMIAPY